MPVDWSARQQGAIVRALKRLRQNLLYLHLGKVHHSFWKTNQRIGSPSLSLSLSLREPVQAEGCRKRRFSPSGAAVPMVSPTRRRVWFQAFKELESCSLQHKAGGVGGAAAPPDYVSGSREPKSGITVGCGDREKEAVKGLQRAPSPGDPLWQPPAQPSASPSGTN